MAKSILTDLSFAGVSRIVDLPAPVAAHEPVRLGDLEAEQATPLIAGESLSSGSFIWVDPVTGKAFRANASAGRVARGYTRESALTGDSVQLRTAQVLNGFSGLLPGVVYFLSAVTAGAITTATPSSGFVQRLGIASASDTLVVGLGEPVFLA